jgi:hypothetical protein
MVSARAQPGAGFLDPDSDTFRYFNRMVTMTVPTQHRAAPMPHDPGRPRPDAPQLNLRYSGMPNRTTIDHETQVKLRAWLQRARSRYAAMERVCQSQEIVEAIQLFFDQDDPKGSRSWRVVRQALGHVGQLEAVDCEGWEAFGLWTIIKPSGPVLGPDPDELAPEAELGGVTLNYLIIGKTVEGRMTIAEGLWTAEISLHALHGALQRDAGADLDQLLYDLQRAILAAPVRRLTQYVRQGMVVPAGKGAFLCACIDRAINASTGKLTLFIQANSWIAPDQLQDEQQVRAAQLAALPGENVLGTNWLLPDPIRSYSIRADERVALSYLRNCPGPSCRPSGGPLRQRHGR